MDHVRTPKLRTQRKLVHSVLRNTTLHNSCNRPLSPTFLVYGKQNSRMSTGTLQFIVYSNNNTEAVSCSDQEYSRHSYTICKTQLAPRPASAVTHSNSSSFQFFMFAFPPSIKKIQRTIQVMCWLQQQTRGYVQIYLFIVSMLQECFGT